MIYYLVICLCWEWWNACASGRESAGARSWSVFTFQSEKRVVKKEGFPQRTPRRAGSLLACLDGFTFRRVLDRPAYLCSISCHNNNLKYDSANQNEKKCKWACVLCFLTAMCFSSLNYFISRPVLPTSLQFCLELYELWCKELQYFHSIKHFI